MFTFESTYLIREYVDKTKRRPFNAGAEFDLVALNKLLGEFASIVEQRLFLIRKVSRIADGVELVSLKWHEAYEASGGEDAPCHRSFDFKPNDRTYHIVFEICGLPTAWSMATSGVTAVLCNFSCDNKKVKLLYLRDTEETAWPKTYGVFYNCGGSRCPSSILDGYNSLGKHGDEVAKFLDN
jgi:hypothetical protein